MVYKIEILSTNSGYFLTLFHPHDGIFPEVLCLGSTLSEVTERLAERIKHYEQQQLISKS